MNTTNKPPTWIDSFTPEQRQQQVADDKEAWKGIIGILLCIVAIGVTMATLVVLAISRWT